LIPSPKTFSFLFRLRFQAQSTKWVTIDNITLYVTNIYSSLLKQCSYIKGFKTIFTRKYTRIEQRQVHGKIILQQKIGAPFPENGIDLRAKCSNFTTKLFHIWEKNS